MFFVIFLLYKYLYIMFCYLYTVIPFTLYIVIQKKV